MVGAIGHDTTFINYASLDNKKVAQRAGIATY